MMSLDILKFWISGTSVDKDLQHLLQRMSCNNTQELVQVTTGEKKRIGGPRLYCSLSTSPDAQYLLVAWLERPFSYNVPCGRFPKRIQVWDRSVPVSEAVQSWRSVWQ